MSSAVQRPCRLPRRGLLTKDDPVLGEALLVLLCQLEDAAGILLQGFGVFVAVQRKQPGVGQLEHKGPSDLCHRKELPEGGVVEVIHKLEGLIHAVVYWITAVFLCFLSHTHTHTGSMYNKEQMNDIGLIHRAATLPTGNWDNGNL